MKILITGSDGQLGKELRHLLCSNNYNVTLANKYDLDICNTENVYDFLDKHKFDIVINCAAYTKVDLCEINKEKSFAINSFGAKNLAIACNNINATLIYISTDYVFDGNKTTPYKEYDNINPQSIYGKSKALGEFYTKMFCKKHFIIRTSWLYGDGHNFVNTMINLSKYKDSIDVVYDQLGSPTSTKDLAICIINLMQTKLYGIYHATCTGYCSWYEFACEIFRFLNINIKVNPITYDQFNSSTPRPKYSVLDNSMLRLNDLDNFRDWKDALREYLCSF